MGGPIWIGIGGLIFGVWTGFISFLTCCCWVWVEGDDTNIVLDAADVGDILNIVLLTGVKLLVLTTLADCVLGEGIPLS